MGRELTKRYSVLFDRKIVNPLAFARDLYNTGKFAEVASFVVWEFLHRLCLFPKAKYLKFSAGDALSLDAAQLGSSDFNHNIDRLFRNRGLEVSRCQHNWKLLFIARTGEMFGCLYPDARDLYRGVDNGASIIFRRRFPERIKSIFISSQDTIFVCTKGVVYRSCDAGESFTRVLDLGSSESFFRHNNGMTETPDKTLIIGEYGNVWDQNRWRKLAYLYISSDNGETWDRSDFLIQKGTNKHVHLVKYSNLFNKVFMADGDNKKKLWVSTAADFSNPQWRAVNRFHVQMGGYTSVVEDDKQLWFGTDYQGGTNFVVATEDGEKFAKMIVPDPYRRSPIDNMLQRKAKDGREIWANLPFSTSRTRCLLMYTVNRGRTWTKVVEYSRQTHKVWLISSAREIADKLYFSIENSTSRDRVVYRVGDRF